MEKAEIGLIGLGVMGSNLALNIAEKGHRDCRLQPHDRAHRRILRQCRRAAATDRSLPDHGGIRRRDPSAAPDHHHDQGRQAGRPADRRAARLLSANDIIIDAGNANFRDTMRRFAELKDTGLTFIGMGVSGGEEGARHGPSIMVGGTEESWKRVEKVLTSISAKYEGEPCAPGSALTAPAISSRPSTTASNMPTCR